MPDNELVVLGQVQSVQGQPVRAVTVSKADAARILTGGQAARMAEAIPAGPPRASRPLGFGVHVFANGGAVAAQLQAVPSGGMDLFRFMRLALSRNNVGVASPGLTVTVTDIRVGGDSILCGVGELPLEAFTGDASLKANIDTGPISPNTPVVIELEIDAAPAVGETVTVGAVMFPA